MPLLKACLTSSLCAWTLRCLTMLVLVGLVAPAHADRVRVADHELNNLFSADEPVTFKGHVRNLGVGRGQLTVKTTDYFGKTETQTVPIRAAETGNVPFMIELGTMKPGYYEMEVTLQYREESGETASGELTQRVRRIRGSDDNRFNDTEPFSFGVAPFMDRTAEEARAQGSRFGLKIWKLGEPGVWWRGDTIYDVSKYIEATVKLGLQWTRHDFVTSANPDEPGIIGTYELLENHEVNVVHKVEGYPVEDAWDEDRYGPYEKWKEENPRKSASRTTVPAKEPYQAWLKEQINKLPEDQDVFEIGNEVWNYMSGEEAAAWAQIAREAIKDVRPNAKVGFDPGLISHMRFGIPFINAGGMDGMDIAFMHPYSFTPLPEHRIRPWIRNSAAALRDRTGEDYEVWVTEYGWPVAPENDRGVSEAIQAQRTTRQSLMMYAEDIKALIPHWMADRDYDVTDWDQWFGFYRLSGQPRPVLIAHATAARMIDGSKFVGDLWYGPGVGALLFERDGQHTLALWTAEEDKRVEVDAGVSQITLVNLMGGEETRQTDDGKLPLDLDGNVTYLVGVSPELARQATPPGEPLNPDRWSTRKGSFTMKRASDVQIDGRLTEWDDAETVELTGDRNGGRAEAVFKWDERRVYVAMKVADTEDNPGEFTVNLSTVPWMGREGRGFYEYTHRLTPGKDGGHGRLHLSKGLDLETGEYSDGQSDPGHRWAVQATDNGWTAELAIPVDQLKGYPDREAGNRIAVQLVYKRGDNTLTYGPSKPRLWPYLEMQN